MIFVTLLFLLVLMGGIKGLIPFKNQNIVELSLSCFFCLPIFLTLISISIPGDVHIQTKTLFFGLGIASLLLIIKDRYFYLKNFSGLIKVLFFIVSVLVIYVSFYGSQIRFFQSPDNHGIASTIGYFSDNFSYQFLKNEFLEVTGLIEPVFEYQKTPLLPSVWTIPNLQLRYASDMIFAVGRMGLPLLGALLGSPIDSLNSFPVFMLLLGVIGASYAAYLLVKIYEFSFIFLTADDQKEKNVNPFILYILVFGSWTTIFILEGTLTQLWLIVAYQFHILQLLRCVVQKNKEIDLLSLFIAPIFISVIYPHGSILLILISMPLIALKMFHKGNLHEIKYEVIGTLSFIPLTVYLLGSGYFFLISRMLKGDSGTPYNLGNSNIFQYLPGLPYTFMPINGSQYVNYFDSLLLTKISSAVLILFLIFLAYKSSRIRKNIGPFLMLLIPLGFTILVSYMAFKKPYQPYLFSRYCILYIAIGFPITIAITFYLFNSIWVWISKKFIVISTLGLILTICSFLIFTFKFNKYSEEFNLVDSIEAVKVLDLPNSILVSNQYDHRILSLSLFTKSYYLTSDEAYSFITPSTFDKLPVKVYQVSVNNERMAFELIGSIYIRQNLQKKITATDILIFPGFTSKN